MANNEVTNGEVAHQITVYIRRDQQRAMKTLSAVTRRPMSVIMRDALDAEIAKLQAEYGELIDRGEQII